MLGISLTVLFSALAAFAVWSYYINPALKSNVKKDNNAMYIIAAAAVAFILRLILGAVYRGHNTDKIRDYVEKKLGKLESFSKMNLRQES